jgi:hypothetical protein
MPVAAVVVKVKELPKRSIRRAARALTTTYTQHHVEMCRRVTGSQSVDIRIQNLAAPRAHIAASNALKRHGNTQHTLRARVPRLSGTHEYRFQQGLQVRCENGVQKRYPRTRIVRMPCCKPKLR